MEYIGIGRRFSFCFLSVSVTPKLVKMSHAKSVDTVLACSDWLEPDYLNLATEICHLPPGIVLDFVHEFFLISSVGYPIVHTKAVRSSANIHRYSPHFGEYLLNIDFILNNY